MAPVPAPLLAKLREIEPDPQVTFGLDGFCARSSAGPAYYLKMGTPETVEQYQGEARSLEMIEAAAPGLAPQVFQIGIVRCKYDEDDEEDGEEERPYMISQYKFLQPLKVNNSLQLAKRLALELHAFKSEQGFGFDCPTYCGSTRTQGTFFDTWAACFADMISSLLLKLKSQDRYSEVVQLGEQIVTTVIPFLLGPPLQVEPVLLHGDLWSGNVGADPKTDQPVLYDPASYFGHNEAELSIMRMFGGFSTFFFDEYHKHRPKSHPVSEYGQRQNLYQIFHYLNHTCIFRTEGYASEAKSRCRELLTFVKNHKGPRL